MAHSEDDMRCKILMIPLSVSGLLACGIGEEGTDSASALGARESNGQGAFDDATEDAFPTAPGTLPMGPGAPNTPAGGAPALPPEVELDLEFELPHAGENYVYAANPQSDSVAVIDADTLAIQAVEAGDQPTFLQTLAGTDAAVVLNVGSSDATIVRTSSGDSATINVAVQQGANAIAVSPDGHHAVVYFDALHRGAGVSGSYQDISVLFLDRGDEKSVAMTVGFRPSAVSFSDDGTRAFVVTEDGVSVLDLAEVERQGAHIARTVPLGSDATASLDVSLTPDGRYALARREGESQLRLADLDSEELHLIDLATLLTPAMPEDAPPIQPGAGTGPEPARDGGGVDADAGVPSTAMVPPMPAPAASPAPVPAGAAITDVDLAPSGDYALAVVRDRSSVLRLPIPDAFTQNAEVEVISVGDELVGSVSISPDSNTALLYTTVVNDNERLTLLDIASGDYDVVRLPKAIERVTLSPDSQTALLIHSKLPGSPDEPGLTPDAVIDRSYGYSVLDLDSGFSKLQVAATQVGPSTVVPSGTDLFVLFNDPALQLREVHQVDLASFLVKRRVLGSPPTSIGTVPGSRKVFVGQEHQDGRITFIDWETGDMESVTGFELNSRIRE